MVMVEYTPMVAVTSLDTVSSALGKVVSHADTILEKILEKKKGEMLMNLLGCLDKVQSSSPNLAYSPTLTLVPSP